METSPIGKVIRTRWMSWKGLGKGTRSRLARCLRTRESGGSVRSGNTVPQFFRLWNPAGQFGGLFDPDRHLLLIKLVLFVDIEPADFLAAFGAAGWNGFQRGAVEEGDLDVAGEDV